MPNEKREKIILTGKSGSGKDFLLRGLVKKGLRYSPKFTTRPKRDLETEGIEYNFIDNKLFQQLSQESKVKVYQEFTINGEQWYYGITKENFEDNQVFIMTPFEIQQLSEQDIKDCFLVYLDIDMEIRRNRISKRNDNNDSIERRIKADELDFKDFNKYDLKVTDPDFEADWIYDLMI